MRTLIALAVLWAAAAQGAVLDASLVTTGTLATAQTATGASANSIKVGRGKYRTLVVTSWNTAGTATTQLEINCTGAATGWGLVTGSSNALTVGAAAVSVVYPLCEYRVNATACATCSVNASFFLGPEMQ